MATPRKEREQPSDLCDALKADFHEHPGGVAALALAMGANEHTLRSYASDQISGDTFRRVAAMVGHLARGGNTATIKLICRMCGGAFAADGGGAITPGNALQWVSRMLRETGDANAAVAEAFADGVITPSEAMQVAQEIDEAIAVLRRTKRAILAEVGDLAERAR